jgi:hypothetical protein
MGASVSQSARNMNFLSKHKAKLLSGAAVVSAGLTLKAWYDQSQKKLVQDAEAHYSRGKDLYKKFDSKRRDKNSGLNEAEVLAIGAEAAEAFSLSIEVNPTVNALNNRSNIYIILKRFKDAFDDAQASIALKKNARGYMAAGMAAKALKSYKTAKKAFAAALVQEDIGSNPYVRNSVPKQIATCEKLIAKAEKGETKKGETNNGLGSRSPRPVARAQPKVKAQATPVKAARPVVYTPSSSPVASLSKNVDSTTPEAQRAAVAAFSNQNNVDEVKSPAKPSTPAPVSSVQPGEVFPHPASIEDSDDAVGDGEVAHPAALEAVAPIDSVADLAASSGLPDDSTYLVAPKPAEDQDQDGN